MSNSAARFPKYPVDFDEVRALAAQGLYLRDIVERIGYAGDPRILRASAERRGIKIAKMTRQQIGEFGRDAAAAVIALRPDTRQPPQYPQQVTVAPFQVRDSEPDRGGKPMFADRTNDAIAGMRARGAYDREIAQALKLTPTQAAAYGLRVQRASDPFGTDPRTKKGGGRGAS